MSLEGATDRGDASYQTRLGATLRLRDVAALREFLTEQARTFGDDRQVEALASQSDADLEPLMHRMILARADLADLHAASRAALGMDPALKKRSSRQPRRRG
jgi:hypothetical protein